LIRVYVRLYGELRELIDFGDSEGLISLPYGSTLETLNENLDISMEEVVVMLVNGVAVSEEAVLQEGDRVDIFPPLSGG
jgi:molybdopterin converting factor small subunit